MAEHEGVPSAVITGLHGSCSRAPTEGALALPFGHSPLCYCAAPSNDSSGFFASARSEPPLCRARRPGPLALTPIRCLAENLDRAAKVRARMGSKPNSAS